MAEGREFPFGGLTRFLFLPDINILKLTQATRLSQLGSQRSVPDTRAPSLQIQLELLSPPITQPAGTVRSASQVVFFFRTSVVIVMKLCD
jgi:hypothetical protein